MDSSLFDRWESLLPYGSLQTIPENTMVYLQSQEPEYMYYLRSGSVKSVILSDAGEEKILRVFSPGEIFGEASFFEGKPRISTAITLGKSELIRFRKEDIFRAIDEKPQLAIEMLQYLSETVRMLSDHVGSMAFLSAHERVCAYLQSQASAMASAEFSNPCVKKERSQPITAAFGCTGRFFNIRHPAEDHFRGVVSVRESLLPQADSPADLPGARHSGWPPTAPL